MKTQAYNTEHATNPWHSILSPAQHPVSASRPSAVNKRIYTFGSRLGVVIRSEGNFGDVYMSRVCFKVGDEVQLMCVSSLICRAVV
jgi:hypothetical protein